MQSLSCYMFKLVVHFLAWVADAVIVISLNQETKHGVPLQLSDLGLARLLMFPFHRTGLAAIARKRFKRTMLC